MYIKTIKIIDTELLPEYWEDLKIEDKLNLFQKLDFIVSHFESQVKQVKNKILEEVDKPLLNEDGSLTTTVLTQDGVEIAGLFEWKQTVKKAFNFQEAEEEGIDTTCLYQKEPMTKENIRKELRAKHIANEKIEDLFNVPVRHAPSIATKKLQ